MNPPVILHTHIPSHLDQHERTSAHTPVDKTQYKLELVLCYTKKSHANNKTVIIIQEQCVVLC